MTKFRDGMIGPTLILCAICLIITVALAATYQVTLPIIEKADADAADSTRQLVLPEAQGFTQVAGIELPEGMLEAYASDNEVGYVFKVQSKGFDGFVTFMVGVDMDGNYVGIDMFDHTETPGLGTKVGEPAYLEQYYGLGDPDAVDSISGATRTSNALKDSLAICNETYGLLTGKGA